MPVLHRFAQVFADVAIRYQVFLRRLVLRKVT